MQGSKINELSESTFREKRQPRPRHSLRHRLGSAMSNISADLEGHIEDIDRVDHRKLVDYSLKLPSCSYHHEPIRFLCMSSSCRASNYAICSQPQCRQLHSQPDSDLIELDTLNELVMANCASLVLLGENVKKYLGKVKEGVMRELQLGMERIQYLLDNVYMNEVPVLIRQKRHKEITSSKLFQFITKDIYRNNPHQRDQMEQLKTAVANRIAEYDRSLKSVINSKEYSSLMLGDIIHANYSPSGKDIMSQLQIKEFQSSILRYKDEFELICKMLKQNRAPSFQKITSIFQASQHDFSAQTYHQAVDGKVPTLTLVKSVAGKKFGAFLNCKMSQSEDWISDASGLSFLFCLEREEVFKMKSDASSRLKAAFGGIEGPQIGSGCDLYLTDRCHQNKRNGANLGGSFRLPPHLQFGSSRARAYLAGEELFQVQEYEVFLLQ